MLEPISATTEPTGGFEPAPRVVLFDLDDTLCDYAAARATRLRLAFAAERHPAFGSMSDERRERLVADGLSLQLHGVDHFPELLVRHGIDDPAAADAAMAWCRTNRYHGLELFPDAAAVVRALRTSFTTGRRSIGVVTNGPAEVQRPKIELLGIDQLADFVVISGEFGTAKPDPAIFREALRLASAAPAEAVFVGDSPEFDMAGAKSAGIRTIWVNRGGRDWPSAAPAPDRQVAGLGDLVELLAVV
jgi:HAD superfamily hydrolase (TIGR01509 family)